MNQRAKLVFRMRRYARKAGFARLAGRIQEASTWDREIEKVYALAKRQGLREGFLVNAEQKGRSEAMRLFDRESHRGKAYVRDPRKKKRTKKGYPQKRCRSSVVTQSVVFDKKRWKSRKALAWLKKHKFKSGKADVTKASLRYRQLPPSYVKVVGGKEIKKGVRLILGCPKRGGKKRRDPGGLPNGLAKRAGKRPSDFNRRELLRGTRVEMEHTTSRHIACQIAMDHLTEDPHYYRRKTSRDSRREKLRWRMQRSDGPFRIEIHYKRGGKRTLPRLYTNRALADRVARRWMGRLERFPDVRRVEVVTVR